MSPIELLYLKYTHQFNSLFDNDFETWLGSLLRLMYTPEDFQPVRNAQGDGGIDFLVLSEQHVYQAYAPAQASGQTDGRTATKINRDFAKAKRTLEGALKRWTFVHNNLSGKLGQKSLKALSNLEAHHCGISIGSLGCDQLWDKVKGVGLEELARTLNVELPPSESLQYLIERFAVITSRDAKPRLIYGMEEPISQVETGFVEEALETGKPVLIYGDAGVGKSGLAFKLSKPRKTDNRVVLYVDASAHKSINCANDLAHALELRHGMIESISMIARSNGCRLIVDQTDSAASHCSGHSYITLAVEASRLHNVQVVVLSRTQESYEKKLISPLVDAGFLQIPCNELSDGIVELTLKDIGITTATSELVKLCRNLLNLDIVARIYAEAPDYDFSSILSEVDLWEKYVEIVELCEDQSLQGPDFGARVIAEATRLARAGLAVEQPSFVITPPSTLEQRRLLSWGILEQQEGYSHRFRHEKLRDFFYVRDAVKLGTMPAEVLDQVHGYRVQSILLWMNNLYPKLRKSKHLEFVRGWLHG